MSYRVITSADTIEEASIYARQLNDGVVKAGGHLSKQLAETSPTLSPADLLQCLLRTKQPQIFAESAIVGDGSDWNATELRLLGDISIAANVQVFDDGQHHKPMPHNPPFPGTLVFTCGALLRNGYGNTMPDLAEVAPLGAIDEEAYDGLYARRLAPVLAYIQASAEQRNRDALVTVPGLGCGQFAGPFQGQLGFRLEQALARLLETQAPAINRIKAIIFDPYNECSDAAAQFGGLQFRTRPLTSSQNAHPQLCPPTTFEEDEDDFSDCDLYSLVAWDHVSWPGNDFFAGLRATDDGVKAAATSSMHAITGIPGRYDPERSMFLPPSHYASWSECVKSHGLQLDLGDPFISDRPRSS